MENVFFKILNVWIERNIIITCVMYNLRKFTNFECQLSVMLETTTALHLTVVQLPASAVQARQSSISSIS